MENPARQPQRSLRKRHPLLPCLLLIGGLWATPGLASEPPKGWLRDLQANRAQILRAASAGDAYAVFKVGEMQLYGIGQPEDEPAAERSFWRAAELGSPKAMTMLGLIAEHGPRADQEEAVRWYLKAAKAGDEAGMHNLAVVYGCGCYKLRDQVQATYWFGEAARRGDTEAQVAYAVRLLTGLGTAADPQGALHWYEEAAQRGDVDGQWELALVYSTGRLGREDPVAALPWVLRAANQGHRDAQLKAMELFGYSEAIPHDYVQSLKWLLIADASTGPVESGAMDPYKGARMDLLTRMSDADAKKARALARQWRPKIEAQP